MAVLSRPISEPEVVLIVAIDFGTTWSGICWVFSNNLENPRVVRVWPASDGTVETSEKVPTRIAYDAEGKPYAWGLMIKGNQKRYQEFKLNLDDSRNAHHAKMANAYPDPASLPFTFPFKPAKLSIDFLHELREWLESDVDNEMGAGHFSSLKVEYVITVPAIWSDNAKKLTKFCAEKAGMGNNVKIISEPEAAMVYVIETLPEEDFEESACLTLCDAGGGTVDLITYRVKSLEPRQVEEVIVGDGDRCGSVFIDRQFKCYIEAIYGKLATWSTQDTLDAVDCFERITKRKFDDGDDDLIVKVSPKHAYDKTKARVKKGKMFVPAADIRQMFAASADIIVVLISEQRRRALKLGLHIMGVLLVGGFGQSKYLQNQLETALKKLDKDLKLYLARDAWTAVERGALSRLLPVVGPKQAQAKVAARIARRHYGITRSREYHPFQDQNMEHKKFLDPLDSNYYIEVIDWFLAKGKVVKEDYQTDTPYFHDWLKDSRNEQAAVLRLNIDAYDGEEHQNPPMYPSSEGVEHVTALLMDCSRIPQNLLTGQLRGDQVMLWCDPWLRITYAFATIQYTLHYRGKDYGSVEAGFEA